MNRAPLPNRTSNTHESVEFTQMNTNHAAQWRTQRTREVWWTHNKRREVTTWAWISKPISPGKMLLNINKSSEENDTYRIPWNMLKVENNINHYRTLQLQHPPWIELEKNHLIWHTSAHQLLLCISSYAMQSKTPESPLSDLVSPVSLSKKMVMSCNNSMCFFPRIFTQRSSASFIVCFGPKFNALLAARSKVTVFKPRGRGSNSWRDWKTNTRTTQSIHDTDYIPKN